MDAGISCRETFKRMKALGEDPKSLSAILITHEHSDHVYGLAMLARKLRIPVFMTGATHAAWARALRNENGERPQLEGWSALNRDTAFRSAILRSSPSPFRMTPPIPWVLPSGGGHQSECRD